jgi:hypothetical protein
MSGVIFRPGLAEVQNPEVGFFLSTAVLLLVRMGFVGLEFWAYDSVWFLHCRFSVLCVQNGP